MNHAVDANGPTGNTRILRRAVYAVLITVSAGQMLGRILAVDSVDRLALDRAAARRGSDLSRRRPFLSANDRSRWLTVRALVEHGTYAIDDVLQEPGWDTIDMVRHADRQGRQRLYSSKPPLLPTIVAGPYWLIYRVTGATLGTHPYFIGRALLVLFNWLPMLLYFAIVARWCERYGTTDWGRFFVMACATFATFLSTFVVVLNNHLVAAVFAALTIDLVLRIVYEDQQRPGVFFGAGFVAAMTAANELPALAMVALLGGGLFVRYPKLTLLAFAPGVLLVAAAFFGTNYAAHASWRPPYLHRSPGDNWYDYTYERNGRTVESYWNHPVGVDRGEASPAVYAFHVLIGHHGIFSLTPVWLLSLWGTGIWLASKSAGRREIALLVACLTLVCLAFYLSRPLSMRNYGGVTSGFRWMFWFAPMWLLTLLPAVDRMARVRWARAIALLLLAVSVVSVSYPTWNPWTHPWIYDALHQQ